MMPRMKPPQTKVPRWPRLIVDLQRFMTQQEIADACGFSGQSHVCNLKNGTQKNVSYEVGEKLKALHAKLTKKKPRA